MEEHIPHRLIDKWQQAIAKIPAIPSDATATQKQRRKLIEALCEVPSDDLLAPLVGTIEINEKLSCGALHLQNEQGVYTAFYNESSKRWRERGVWLEPRLEWGGFVDESTDSALSLIISSFPLKLAEWESFVKC